jgi:hypothetical protein
MPHADAHADAAVTVTAAFTASASDLVLVYMRDEEFLVPALSSTSALKSPISQPLLSSFRLDLFSGRKK